MATRKMEEGKGVLFSNDKKGNEKAPDFKGDIMIEGKIHKISGWRRMSAYGELISLQHNPAFSNPNQYPRQVEDIDGGDLPF